MKNEKDTLLSLYTNRCSVAKDYRFCVAYAAYILGDRCVREITRAWTYINPEMQKGKWTPEEDAILLEYAKKNSSICWSRLAARYLPTRSAGKCRARYMRLIKSKSTEKKKQNC